MGIELKAIGDLKDMKFFIPSYQRGYRWTERQVEDLLKDIQEFIESKAGWYCLQPLVVEKYEVIDGQQRLTTIFIILKYLGENLFEIEYETRKGSGDFLQNIEESDGKNGNIDYHHMREAYQTITEWFKNQEVQKESFKKESFKQKLLKNVRFIWYEIPQNENAYTVFKRLNSGKLSLTNSELIKAVILNDEDKEENFRQEDIAREWENIENHLENNNLWYFINPEPNSKKYESTRMDFILETFLLNKGFDLKDNSFIFSECYNRIQNDGWKKVWEDIKATYRTIQTWYNDRKLYHYIGFLMNVKSEKKVTLGKLLQDYNQSDKETFLKTVKSECRKLLNKKPFSELQYGRDNKVLHDILLAFNLATIQNQISETSRYPFNIHSEMEGNSWSLEHIHAQKERTKKWTPEEVNTLKSYIEKIADMSQDKEILTKFAEYVTPDKLEDEETYKAMMAVFMGEEIKFEDKGDGNFLVSSNFEKDDSLMNLALLQSNKNAALNNKTFPEKRENLAKFENAEQETQFIPICTRNVFFKHYSPDATNPFIWDIEAGKDYVKAIIKVVGKFVDAEFYHNFDTHESEIKYGLKK